MTDVFKIYLQETGRTEYQIRPCQECGEDEEYADWLEEKVRNKPALSEVLAKIIENGRKQNGSSILEIEIDALKSVLSEYFA